MIEPAWAVVAWAEWNSILAGLVIVLLAGSALLAGLRQGRPAATTTSGTPTPNAGDHAGGSWSPASSPWCSAASSPTRGGCRCGPPRRPAVFVGRFTAALRALVPGLAGTARMPYRTFLAWNLTRGVLWATAFVLLGVAAGPAAPEGPGDR